MSKLLYLLALAGAVLGGLAIVGAFTMSGSAIQETTFLMLAVALAVVPLAGAMAWRELRRKE